MNQWKTFRPSGINAPCPIDIQLPCGWHSTHYPQKGGLSHTSHMYSICWWMKTMNSNRSLLFSGEQKGTWLLTHADLTPWALKWGIPKSPWVSILKWSSMTWMISGYPHGLGNLHIKLFLYIYPITYPLRLVYSHYISTIWRFPEMKGYPKSSTLIGQDLPSSYWGTPPCMKRPICTPKTSRNVRPGSASGPLWLHPPRGWSSRCSSDPEATRPAVTGWCIIGIRMLQDGAPSR